MDPSTFQNDMTTLRTRDDVLTLLVHLGYLTYNEETEEVFIPNQEIVQEFVRAVKTGRWGSVIDSLERSEGLLKSTCILSESDYGTAVGKGICGCRLSAPKG